MSLLVLDLKGTVNGTDNYKTFKTTLENLGLIVDINLFNDMSDYNGTNPSPNGYDAVIISNYNESTNNGLLEYSVINKNAQTVLMNYLNNGGRLLFNTINLSNSLNINVEKSWGELTKAIYSVNNGKPWNVDISNGQDESAFLFKEGTLDGNQNNTKAVIKKINDSTILNNVSDDFTWNPSKLEDNKDIKYEISIIGYVENLKTNDHVLNSSLLKSDKSSKTYNYPIFLSNSYGKGQVLIHNGNLGGYTNDTISGSVKYYMPILEPNIAQIIYNFVSLSNEEICFVAGSKVQTDQGYINIEDLIPNKHTIDNKNIIAVPKSVPSQLNYLICFEKDALGPNIPNEKTIMTHNHRVEYKGELVQALTFLFGNFDNKIYKVEYNNETLYNVLLKEYSKINVNIIIETLHPDNKYQKYL